LQKQRDSIDTHVDDKPEDLTNKIDTIEERISSVTVRSRPRLVPPFIPMHDIPRGVFQAVQSLFSYTLMLVVM
jgi:copper transporter 1